MRELHWPAKTEQKLALGGWHSANALALLSQVSDSTVKIFYPTTKNEASFHRTADCQTYLHFIKSSNCTRMAVISGKLYYAN